MSSARPVIVTSADPSSSPTTWMCSAGAFRPLALTLFARSAHSFVTGGFGGVRSKAYIGVLSLDGVLSVFEQESHSFSR